MFDGQKAEGDTVQGSFRINDSSEETLQFVKKSDVQTRKKIGARTSLRQICEYSIQEQQGIQCKQSKREKDAVETC